MLLVYTQSPGTECDLLRGLKGLDILPICQYHFVPSNESVRTFCLYSGNILLQLLGTQPRKEGICIKDFGANLPQRVAPGTKFSTQMFTDNYNLEGTHVTKLPPPHFALNSK
jgi:hypothetical protein